MQTTLGTVGKFKPSLSSAKYEVPPALAPTPSESAKSEPVPAVPDEIPTSSRARRTLLAVFATIIVACICGGLGPALATRPGRGLRRGLGSLAFTAYCWLVVAFAYRPLGHRAVWAGFAAATAALNAATGAGAGADSEPFYSNLAFSLCFFAFYAFLWRTCGARAGAPRPTLMRFASLAMVALVELAAFLSYVGALGTTARIALAVAGFAPVVALCFRDVFLARGEDGRRGPATATAGDGYYLLVSLYALRATPGILVTILGATRGRHTNDSLSACAPARFSSWSLCPQPATVLLHVCVVEWCVSSSHQLLHVSVTECFVSSSHYSAATTLRATPGAGTGRLALSPSFCLFDEPCFPTTTAEKYGPDSTVRMTKAICLWQGRGGPEPGPAGGVIDSSP